MAKPLPTAMNAPPLAYLIQTTMPDVASAKDMAQQLVSQKQAACVHIASPGISIYAWNHRIEQSQEVCLTVKTSCRAQQGCIARIRDLHPYDIPEIICLPITAGLTDYLCWINQETT